MLALKLCPELLDLSEKILPLMTKEVVVLRQTLYMDVLLINDLLPPFRLPTPVYLSSVKPPESVLSAVRRLEWLGSTVRLSHGRLIHLGFDGHRWKIRRNGEMAPMECWRRLWPFGQDNCFGLFSEGVFCCQVVSYCQLVVGARYLLCSSADGAIVGRRSQRGLRSEKNRAFEVEDEH